MIITRTPYRVSLFGGGSDIPAFYRNNCGAVLGFSIDRFCWITLRKLPPFFEHRHRIVYSKIELVRHVHEIQHPAVRAILDLDGVGHGVELHHDGDLPARSGLGSSSSFAVGLLLACHAFRGHMRAPVDLASEAIHVEREILKENVGSQDQIWAAYGGFNLIEFKRDDTFSVKPVIITKERKKALQESLILVWTGQSRFSSEMMGKQIENVQRNTSRLGRLRDMAFRAWEILLNQSIPLSALGDMLHEAWVLKQNLAEGVATKEVDEIYARARAAGATGGKLLGAGGGGFMLFYVPVAAQAAVRHALKDLVLVPFSIGAPGAQVVLYEPNGFAENGNG